MKQYKEFGTFPPGVSEETKESIEHLSHLFDLKDRKLYSNAGKSAGRHIITAEKARISLLRKAHARGGQIVCASCELCVLCLSLCIVQQSCILC